MRGLEKDIVMRLVATVVLAATWAASASSVLVESTEDPWEDDLYKGEEQSLVREKLVYSFNHCLMPYYAICCRCSR